MCRVLALKVKHKQIKDIFQMELDNKKTIKFEFDKTSDTVNGIVDELISTLEYTFNDIDQVKKDMQILVKSNRIGGIYYDSDDFD